MHLNEAPKAPAASAGCGTDAETFWTVALACAGGQQRGGRRREGLSQILAGALLTGPSADRACRFLSQASSRTDLSALTSKATPPVGKLWAADTGIIAIGGHRGCVPLLLASGLPWVTCEDKPGAKRQTAARPPIGAPV